MSPSKKLSLKSSQSVPDKSIEKTGLQCLQFEEDTAERRKANNDVSESNVDGTCTVSAHSVKVYLRLKPCLTNVKSWKGEDVYTMLNHSTLLTKFPPADHNTRGSVTFKPKDNTNRKYTFTKIFDSEACQADIFEQSVKNQIEDFLTGQSSTVITYGTANSGKTYTLYGTSESPGIIPRSIQLVFSAINCTLSPWYKPVDGCFVVSLDDAKRMLEDRKKKKILNPEQVNEQQYSAARKSLEKSELEISQDECVECNGENLYSVWLSLAEIYNENVYDLLVEDEDSRNIPLKLMRGRDGAAYVSGLRTVYATTALEACQIVVAGQSKMSIAPTVLNAQSSRSHTIFTIKLLRYQKENVPHEVSVSTLTFCDLAGSGRSRRTQDSKNRLVEARNINNSLLVLGRCLKAVWEGQLNKQNVDNVMGLFRESKLTRMFQRALIGREPVTFLVNIDSSQDLYVETQSVLNFCTIAKKIVVERVKDARKSVSSELNVHSPKTQSITEIVSPPFYNRTPDKSDSVDHDCRVTSDEEKEKHISEVSVAEEDDSLRSKNSDDLITGIIPDTDNFCAKERGTVYRGDVDETALFSQSDSNLRNQTSSPLSLPVAKLLSVDSENDDPSKVENVDLVRELETVKIVALKRECEIRQELKKHYHNVIEGLETNWKEHTKEILQNLNASNYRDAATSPRRMESRDFLWSDNYQVLKNENESLLKEVESLKSAALSNERKIREEMANQYTGIIENMETTWRKRTQEVEEESHDLLKWSVNQVQNFYEERIDSLKRKKKRKRSDSDGEMEEELSVLEKLEAENAQITSKVVVLRESVKKLKEENEIFNMQKNKYSFELAIVKEELKHFQELVRSRFGDCIPADKCHEENVSSRLVDRLKVIIDSKLKTIDTLEKDLEDVRSNYLKISSTSMKTKRELSDTKATLQDSQIQINDLKESLAEKSNQVKTLQMQLNIRDKQLLDARKALDDAKDKNVITSRRIEVLEDIVKNLENKLRNTSLNYEENLLDYKSKFFTENSTGDSACKLSVTMDDSLICDETSNSTLPVFSQVESMKEIFERFDLNCQSNRGSLNISDHDRFSFPETSESVDQSINRSSDCSSKNDSGIIVASQKHIVMHDDIKTTEREKAIAKSGLRGEIVEETLRVRKLAGELETMRQTLITMEQISRDNTCKLSEYRDQVESQEQELKRLAEEKDEITSKYHEIARTMESKSSEYERRIQELSARLTIREESEIRTSKCLEEFLERCSNLENQLSVVHGQLERSTLKCVSEHVPKIEKLEKELLAKVFRINELESKATEGERDLARVYELNEKVNEFEGILEKCQREKDDLRRQLQERSESQIILERKLRKFNSKVQEKENELTSLKTEFGNIMYTNVANSEKVKELNEQISEMIQMINVIKTDLLHSEELRQRIEKSSRQEISTLKLRLAAFEKNTAFLSLIQEKNNEKEEEVERLKSQLREKECELILFKKNRDETIEKYESLVKQLQDDLDKQNDRDFSDVYIRYRLSESIDKPGRMQSPLGDKDSKTKPSYINKEFADEKSTLSTSTLSMSKKCSAQMTGFSSSADDATMSSTSKNADYVGSDDSESPQTESNRNLNKSAGQTQSEKGITSEEFTSAVDCGENQNGMQIFGWMKMAVSRVTPSFKSSGSLYDKTLSGWMKVKNVENEADLFDSSEECTEFDFSEETS